MAGRDVYAAAATYVAGRRIAGGWPAYFEWLAAPIQALRTASQLRLLEGEAPAKLQSGRM